MDLGERYRTCAHQGSVAEWSKALVLGTSLFGVVGSNPTAAKLFKAAWSDVALVHRRSRVRSGGFRVHQIHHATNVNFDRQILFAPFLGFALL